LFNVKSTDKFGSKGRDRLQREGGTLERKGAGFKTLKGREQEGNPEWVGNRDGMKFGEEPAD